MPTPAIGNTTKKLGRGVDTRGRGGYVVAAGSLHILGWRYHWAVDGHPGEVALAPAPAWLVEALTDASTRRSARPIEYYRELAAANIEEGERNAQIASLAGHLLDGLVDPEVVHQIMQGWNLGRCRPPLSARGSR